VRRRTAPSLRSSGAAALDTEQAFASLCGMDPRHESDHLRRSIAMLPPGRRDTLDREHALQLLDDLVEAQGRLEQLRRRLRDLAEG
jgi:hypothetical protein